MEGMVKVRVEMGVWIQGASMDGGGGDRGHGGCREGARGRREVRTVGAMLAAESFRGAMLAASFALWSPHVPGGRATLFSSPGPLWLQEPSPSSHGTLRCTRDPRVYPFGTGGVHCRALHLVGSVLVASS